MIEAGRRLRTRGRLGFDDRRLLGVGLVIALLWALHPIQTATATYVIQRAESLATLFGMLAVWALLRGQGSRPSRGWTAVVIGGVVLAVGSKPTAIVWPAILFAVDTAIVTGSPQASWQARRGLWIGTIVAVAAVLLATGAATGLLVTEGRRSGAGVGVVDVGPIEYAASQVRAVGLYAGLLVDPRLMSIDHGKEALGPAWTLLVGIAMILLALATIVIGWSRHAWWTVLPIVAVLALLPTTSVVPLADPVADHRLHPAMLPIVVGVAVVLIAVLTGVRRRVPGLAVPLDVLAGLGILGLLAVSAIAVDRRNHDYADPARLWADVVVRRPEEVRGLVNRAAVALVEGRHSEAARDLAAAAAIEPGNPVVILNLALLDVHAERPESALQRLAIAEKARPRDPALHMARGDALRMLGRDADAVGSYEIGAMLQPGDPLVRLALGNALSAIDRLDEAADAFHEAAGLADDPAMIASAFYNEGNMRFRQDRLAEAVVAYESALAADPTHSAARRWLQEAKALDGE